MRTFLPKTIAILLGIIFLVGGAGVAIGQEVGFEEVVQGAGKTEELAAAQTPTTSTQTTNVQIAAAQKAVISAQAAYDAAVASGDPARIAATMASLQVAQAKVAQAPGDEDKNLQGLSCSPLKGEIKGCFPIAVYYVIYKPTAYLMMGSGYIFDKTLALSIDKKFVSDPTFINNSWKIIRDFSNMLFIFILLYTGIMTMFGEMNWKRTVIQVVIIALLINFSLFFTKVIIDAGNILATGIYSSINTGSSFSQSLASQFEPQKFLDTAGKLQDPLNSTIIFVIAAIVSVFAAYVFFKAALLFIGRLLAFWFLMIVSPFAFISMTFPKGNKFQDWFGMLLNQAFVAPIFLFLLYIIMQVISAGGGILGTLGGATSSSNPSWFDTLIAPILTAILIIVALHKSLKFAEGMADDFSKLGAKIGAGALGAAVVAPTLGGSVAGGAIRGIGGLASYAASKGFGGGAGGRLDKFGKGTQSVGRGVATAGSALNLHNLPKNLAKIPGVGGALGGIAKVGIGALGIPDYAKTIKGGDAAKGAKDLADAKTALTKFKTTIGLPGDKRDLNDTAVKIAIDAKEDALELAKEIATKNLKNVPVTDPAFGALFLTKKAAEKALRDFNQEHTDAKNAEKKLKDND